jgi:hypothetical protein
MPIVLAQGREEKQIVLGQDVRNPFVFNLPFVPYPNIRRQRGDKALALIPVLYVFLWAVDIERDVAREAFKHP